MRLLSGSSVRSVFVSFAVRRVSEPSMGHATDPLRVEVETGFLHLQEGCYRDVCKSAKGVVLDLALVVDGSIL